jgi:hypothetical protein
MKRRKWTNKSPITNDGLAPMVRLLRQVDDTGLVAVEYDQQWKTFFKAQRQGLVDDDGRITQRGREVSQ